MKHLEVPELDVDDFLEHYGVIGMKWGRRKGTTDPDSSPRRTYPRLTKKQAVIGASILVGVAVTAVILANNGDIRADLKGVPIGYEKSTKDMVDNILRRNADRKDITLPQGQVFSRISKTAEENVRSTTYVSYKQKDNLAYKSTYGSGGKHQVNIESVSDIKMPSRKNKISTLSEMVDNPLETSSYGGRTLREVLVDRERSPKAKEYLNSISSKKLASIVNGRMDVDDFRVGYGAEFVSKLKDKGYSAISDPIDSTSRGQNRKSASILIDEALFKVTNSKQISPEDLDQARKDLKNLLHK